MFFKKNKDINSNQEEQLLDKCRNLVEEDQVDLAIENLENYIDENNKLGKVFTYLMQLYNDELNKARSIGDDNKIKYNLDRIDNLMQRSKDIVRGR